jgi:predicted nucleotidyltransferase
MGISFDREVRIAGYRPAVFKDALRGFMRTQSPGNFIDLKSVFPLRRDGAIVFEECLDRGLIEFKKEVVISEKGETVARGKVTRRTPRVRAQTVLDDFLRRVDQLNNDPDAVRYVEQVWIFGSLMRGEETVGDIDQALETKRRPQYLADYAGMKRHLKELLSRGDDVPAARGLLWSAETWVTGRTLYGTRRHPLLAGVQSDVSDLAHLGVPCRLIYVRTRGGRVNDPILPRHPQSNGRHNDLAPPAEIPDLTPNDIRPMDGRWVAGYSDWGGVSPYDVFRGWTDDAHKLFPDYPDGLRVVGDGCDLRNYPWVPKCLKASGVDGREVIALVNATAFSGTSVALQRRIEKDSTTWTLNAWFENLELYRSRKRIDLSTLPAMAAAAALILAVDAERMLRRAAEESAALSIQIRIRHGLDKDMNEYLVEAVHDHLQTRAIRIEPESWSGPPVSVVRA